MKALSIFVTPMGYELRIPPEVEAKAMAMAPKNVPVWKWLNDSRTKASKYLWDWALTVEKELWAKEQ